MIHVYHSADLTITDSKLKAVHILIRDRADDDPLLLPHEIVVLVDVDGRGHIPVPMVRAHKNEPDAEQVFSSPQSKQ